mgnify:CR=1 FL=1
MTDNDKARDASWGLRILLVLGWTGLCAFVAILWVGGMATTPAAQDPDAAAALGMASCIAVGCSGGVWFLGLIAGLVIYGLVRR